MIQAGKVHLEGTFAVCLAGRDGVMSFPDFSVSMIPGVDTLVRLVKRE
jgi:hypothetical protein